MSDPYLIFLRCLSIFYLPIGPLIDVTCCNFKIERTQRAIKTDEHFRTLLTPEVLSAYLFGIFNKPWAG